MENNKNNNHQQKMYSFGPNRLIDREDVHEIDQTDGFFFLKKWINLRIVESWIISGWWFRTFFIFPSIGNSHPNWLSNFSEGWPNHQPDFVFSFLSSGLVLNKFWLRPVSNQWTVLPYGSCWAFNRCFRQILGLQKPPKRCRKAISNPWSLVVNWIVSALSCGLL